MMDSTNKGICPQCGAQGTAGRFCEYCGTKIPELVIEDSQKDDNTPFSWFNVIPVGYQISEEDVIGDPQKSLFMVVKAGETRQYVQTEYVQDFGNYGHTEIRTHDKGHYKYGIINRQGKFVVDCNKRYIQLIQETNYYYYSSLITGCMLQNLVSGDIVINDSKYDGKHDLGYIYKTTFMEITDRIGKKFSLFDMKNNCFVELPSVLSDLTTKYKNCFMFCSFKDGYFVFHKHEYSGDYDYTDTDWKVKIEDGKVEIIDKNIKKETPYSYRGCILSLCVVLFIAVISIWWLSSNDSSNSNTVYVEPNMISVPSGFVSVNQKNIEISGFKITQKPIEQLKRGEALEYINELNAKTGRNYKLPTEMQLRYAYQNNYISGEIYDIMCSDFYLNDGDLYKTIENKDPKGPSTGTEYVALTLSNFGSGPQIFRHHIKVDDQFSIRCLIHLVLSD